MDEVEERLREQLLRRISQNAVEILIDLLEESVEPGKAEKIQREFENLAISRSGLRST